MNPINLNEIEAANRKRLLDCVRRIPKGVPAGWERTLFAVGGLMYLGFSNLQTEKLIVTSAQGQRVIDCRAGEKTRCDGNYDADDLIALAGGLGEELVPIAGEEGGGLRRCSKAGDSLVSAAPLWPKEQIIFMPEFALWHESPEKCTVIFDGYEIKAFGFSRCGAYMAVGSADTLAIFKRLG